MAGRTMVVWGLWWQEEFCFSSGGQSRKAHNLKHNPNCVVCNENADQAVIVEGIAKPMSDPTRIRKFLKLYEKKYMLDMSDMADDMISMKEPAFAVLPRKVFGQDHKTFAKTATRWLFKEHCAP